eukprot:7185668-Prymnesium_polylepis.1
MTVPYPGGQEPHRPDSAAMLTDTAASHGANDTGSFARCVPSPPPGRSPWAPVPRVDRYGIGVDPSKRSAPGFAVSGDCGVDSGALRPSHHARRADRRG